MSADPSRHRAPGAEAHGSRADPTAPRHRTRSINPAAQEPTSSLRERPTRAASRPARDAAHGRRNTPRPTRSAGRDEAPDPSERPYGAWYPLVRLGHFLLMATTSCLIILTGFGLLAALIYLVTTLTK
jgi:hypothetical protein